MENSSSSSSKPLILFAEDDEDFFVITRYALEQAGFTGVLKRVKSSRELMSYLQESGGKPHLILLDLHTTSKDWRAALQEIKGDERYREIPVVVLSARDPEDHQLSAKYPECAYIEKPLDFGSWKACMEGMVRENLP